MLKVQESLLSIRNWVCSGTWKSIFSTVVLPTSPEEQQLPQKQEDTWHQEAEADAGKPGQEIVLREHFKLAHPTNMGFNSSPLLFHSRTKKNRK